MESALHHYNRVSAVSDFAVTDGGDLNSVVAFEIEEDAVVAAAETKAGKRRFELFHVAGAAGQIAIDAVQNLQKRSLGRQIEDQPGLSATR